MNFCVDEVVEDLPPCDHCVMTTQLYAIIYKVKSILHLLQNVNHF